MPQITAESTPEYDVPFWPFDEAWTCQNWMEWHKKLAEKYGRQEANKRFLEAWQKQGFWEFNRSFCKYNSTFTGYFESVGLDPHNYVSNIVEDTKETGQNLGEAAKNLSGSLANNTLIKVAGALAVVGGLYFWLFNSN